MSTFIEKAKELLALGKSDPKEAEARRLLNAFEKEASKQHFVYEVKASDHVAGRAILQAAPEIQTLILTRLYETHDWSLNGLIKQLQSRKLPFTAENMERYLEAVRKSGVLGMSETPIKKLQQYVESGNEITAAMGESLRQMYESLNEGNATERRIKSAIGALRGEKIQHVPVAGETWADAFRADFARMTEEEKARWSAIIAQAHSAEGGKPSSDWIYVARQHIAAIGADSFASLLARWLAKMTLPTPTVHRNEYRGQVHESLTFGSERNISLLKGLAWYGGLLDSPDLARALGKMVEGCLKKVPGVGPWAVRAANASVWALSEMPCAEAVAQLGRLKTRVTFRTTLNLIENALEQAAARAGVTKAELEDLAVQDYGLDASGTRREIFGDYAATLNLSPVNGDVSLTWEKAGKPLKSVPAEVKKTYADDWKAFKADADGVAQTVSTQRERLDRAMFPVRAWTLGAWRERYLDHPILGSLSRRLLWQITEGEQVMVVLLERQQAIGNRRQELEDSAGRAVEGFSDAAAVQLWHPITAATEEVLRWRGVLEARGIVQPFKQAHREIYLLTDAERNTRTYSNRYAGHILKQHQFNQLCALRGWKNKLRLMVDDEYPPATRILPEYNLRAEFWVEGIGDDYGTDTTDSGTYLRLSTDQVRFYPLEARDNYAHAGGGGYGVNRWGTGLVADPLPVEEISALPFSEVMRDVDLFVGVASVGNDPTWQDGGPQGRFRDYWQDYSFGDLSESAKTRAEVLAKLLPRLKIADRTRIEGRFLYVRGDLRTYKIHLGSGNILMESNDQYLCIVQNRSSEADGSLFIPFEGDQRLSLILSKAFLLAEDTKISDATIIRQIKL